MGSVEHFILRIGGIQMIVPIDYDCYEEEELLQSQREAAEQFAQCRLDPKEVQGYLYMFLKSHGKCDVPLQIFYPLDYVTPQSLFVPRSSYYEVELVCRYCDAPEEGCRLFFKEGKLTAIQSGFR